MKIKWTPLMDEFLKDRRFQSLSKTRAEFLEEFNQVILNDAALDRRYTKLFPSKSKKAKDRIKVHCRKFRARGNQYWYTIAKQGTTYIGALRSDPYTIEISKNIHDLRIKIRAAKINYLKDMDKLIDPATTKEIRFKWVYEKLTINELSRTYDVSKDVIYGIVNGHIQPEINYPKGVPHKSRGMQIEVFPGEPKRTIADWTLDPRCKTSWRSIYNRYNKGMVGPELLQETTQNSMANYYCIYGEYKTILEWIDDPRCEVTWQCLRKRIRLGHPVEASIIKLRKSQSPTG